jgi:hypothetical protein
MRDVQSDMILENLGHQAVHPAANRRQQHQDIGALISFGDRPLHRADLSTQPLNSRKQFLFFFGNSDSLSFSFLRFPALFLDRYPRWNATLYA